MVLVDDTFGPVTVNLNTYSPVVDGAVNLAFALSTSESSTSTGPETCSHKNVLTGPVEVDPSNVTSELVETV